MTTIHVGEEETKSGVRSGQGQRRKSVLVVFPRNHIGGSMTALMNFLNAVDPEKYDVDLLFGTIAEDMPKLPAHVRLLEQARVERSCRKWDPLAFAADLFSRLCIRLKKNSLPSVQLIMQHDCLYTRKTEKKYDIAFAYELNWCMYYIANRVKAERKIVLFHNDYHEIGYCYALDRRYMKKMDALAFVSEETMKRFLNRHPDLKKKSWFVPNVTASQAVRERADAAPEKNAPDRKANALNLLTVARVSFPAKGLDRMIPVCVRLREAGLLDHFRWVVLGGGEDLKAFRSMIVENHLEDNVIALGSVNNPLPYLKLFDAMLLPSRNEGKPMAVTEAQILGIPPVVTRYTSAGGQIENGVDGLIFENNEDALFEGICQLIRRSEMLEPMRTVLKSRSYSNEADIRYFDQMINALLNER